MHARIRHNAATFSHKELTDYLEKQGVETRPVVAGNQARYPVAKLFTEFKESDYPGADAIHARGFYVGLSPLQTDDTMDRLIECFRRFLSKY